MSSFISSLWLFETVIVGAVVGIDGLIDVFDVGVAIFDLVIVVEVVVFVVGVAYFDALVPVDVFA